MEDLFDFFDDPITIGGIVKFLMLPIMIPMYALMTIISMLYRLVVFIIKVLVVEPLKKRKIDKER